MCLFAKVFEMEGGLNLHLCLDQAPRCLQDIHNNPGLTQPPEPTGPVPAQKSVMSLQLDVAFLLAKGSVTRACQPVCIFVLVSL